MVNHNLINEIIKKIGNHNDDILLISDKKDVTFKFDLFLKFDDLPHRKNKYNIVVSIMRNHFEKKTLENILSLSKKYTILAVPFYVKLIQSTEKIIEYVCSVNLENRYDINVMPVSKNPIQEYLEHEKIPYVKSLDLHYGQNQGTEYEIFVITKNTSESSKIKSLLDEKLLKIEDLGTILNITLIQNLKKQISEKENTITKRNKDIEMLERHKDGLEKAILQINKDKKKLNSDIESKDNEIEKLNKERESAIKELIDLNQLVKNLKKLTKEKNNEIKILKKELEEIHNSISYRVGSRVGKTTVGKLLKGSLKNV